MMKGKLLIKQPVEQSFHPLKTTTKLVFRERCRHCGCTHNNPCYHPNYGFCWWEDSKHTICSHCADKEIKNSKLTQHRVNDIPDWQPPEETQT